MKTFLNVLYRRILYKIPLKLLLILLVLFGLLFLGFSNAGNVSDLIVKYCSDGTTNCEYSFDKTLSTSFSNILSGLPAGENFCFNITSSSNPSVQLDFSFNNTSNNPSPATTFSAWTNRGSDIFICSRSATYFLGKVLNVSSDTTVNIKGDIFVLSDLLATALPVYTSLECQTEYNLVPISSIDQSYCESNNLCPTYDCPTNPIGTGSLSNLYINNILHVGSPTILMDIPEEIEWDYEYTMGGNVMNIDIVGYNVDYDKINEQINLQNFKPSSEDLSNVVSGIIPLFVPGLCIILLLYFIFKFIKKIF